MASFLLNGKMVDVAVEPDTPLLWTLREHLQLSGTKFGCGMALCGACTVHLNGVAIRSCVTPVSVAEGQKVTTIEGLSGDGELHPLQKAWQQFGVPQCGYCQSGQLMQAASLLQANPSPTEIQIDEAMSGNICRCGTYPRIRDAISHVAKATGGTSKP